MAVYREDRAALKSPKREPNGWLRGDAYLTRTGIFEYLRADGTTLRELRLPEHVFDEASLASFGQVPVTNDHPQEELNAENTRRYAVGSVSESVRKDGDFVRGSLLIYDGKTIADMDAGKVELSCGYSCDLDLTPGVWQGKAYDAIQTNIRGNHVAIVDRGRAGPQVKFKMDGAAIMVDKQRDQAMSNVITGGKKYAVSADTHAQIMKLLDGVTGEPVTGEETPSKADRAEIERLRTENSAIKADRDKLQAKVDSVTSAATETQKKEDAAKLRESVRAEVTARLALEAKAGEIIGDAFKADGKSDDAIRREVIKHLDADADFEGKSAEYVIARYDIAISTAAKGNAHLDAARIAAVGGDPAKRTPNTNADGGQRGESAARADMIKENKARGSAPLTVGRTAK